MLTQLAGKIWKKMPRRLRIFVTRSTQDTFTVSVVGLVFNSERQILVLDHILRVGSGWGLPGGFIEPREQPSQALRRELKEETCVDLRNVQLYDVRVVRRHVEIVFTAESDDTPQVNSVEITKAEWRRLDGLPPEMNIDQQFLIERVAKAKFDNNAEEL